MKIYMDEQFAIPEIRIDPEYWQRLKVMNGKEASRDIINKFIQA